ncbi:MAG: hypothetical protein COB76_02410 [Alphaproteobacteria bacterium]|nr:MAG: hypothetical protein COB76_02410 [Alphaproteobacteria bacterium]
MKNFVGHATSYSRKFKSVDFFLFLNSKGAEYFCLWTCKTFDRIDRYASQVFQDHLSKISLAQNGRIR